MNDVAKFIADKGFPEYAENFRKENVDGRLLAHLDEKALACLKIPKKERTEVLKCTSTKVPEFRLVSESLAADRFKRPVLGLIRSFVMKERRVWSVGSKGGRVHLKSTGVTVTLIYRECCKQGNERFGDVLFTGRLCKNFNGSLCRDSSTSWIDA